MSDSPAIPQLSLEYAGPQTRRDLPPAWSTRPMRTVLHCWFFQMLIAVAGLITSALVYPDLRMLEPTGVITLVFGVPLFIFAGISAFVSVLRRWGTVQGRWKQTILPAIAGLLLCGSVVIIGASSLLIAIWLHATI